MEARREVQNLEKNMKRKHDKHLQTLDKVKTKCQSQFEKQNHNYQKYDRMSEEVQQNFS